MSETRFNKFVLRCDDGKSVTIPCGEVRVQPGRRYTLDSEPAQGAICHNMYLCDGELTARPECRRIAPAGWTPLCHVGSGILLGSGQSLGFASGDGVQAIAPLSAETIAVLAHDNRASVHTRDGSRLTVMVKDDECEVTGETRYAPVMISSTDATQITTMVALRRLTGNYPHNTGPLDAADQRTLDADMTEAYIRCMTTAAARGYYSQPVLVRYRLTDAAGATLYVSAPVLVRPSAGFNGMGTVTLLSDDSLTSRKGAQMAVDGYRLCVRVPEQNPGCRAATLLIEATEPLHPIDPRNGTAVTLTQVDQTNVRLQVRWADATSSDSLRTCVEAAMETLEQRMHVVARFDRPYSGGMGAGGEWVTLRSSDTDAHPTHVIDRARRLRPDAITTECRTVRRCSAPHTFVAEGVNADSDMALWREPKYRLAEPGDIAEYQTAPAGDGTGQWRAYVSVTMADGSERVVRACEGTGTPPRTLSSVLAYPCSDARSMTIGVTDGTATYRTTFALTRCTHTDMAWWMSDDGRPARLSANAEAFAVPAQRRLLHGCTGSVLIADGARPDEPLAAIHVSTDTVRDILPDSAGSSLWDKTRRRRRIVCSDGVYLLSVDSALRRTGLRRIYAGHLTAWCVDDARTMYAATDSGAIVSIDDRRCHTLPMQVSAGVTAMCHNSNDRRLTMLGPQGILAEYDPEGHTLRTLDIGGQRASALYDGALAATATGLFDTTIAYSGGTSRASGRCRWRAVAEGNPVIRPHAIVTHITGGDVARPVTVRIQGQPAAGTATPQTMATIRYVGPLTTPHSTPMPRHPHLTITITVTI